MTHPLGCFGLGLVLHKSQIIRLLSPNDWSIAMGMVGLCIAR